MCGRYTLTAAQEEVARRFALRALDEPGHDPVALAGTGVLPGVGPHPWLPRANIAPTQDIAVVRPSRSAGGRVLAWRRWGLVPRWAESPEAVGARMINARAETVASKPSFRAAFARGRCLVPATGYYEWERLPDGKRAPRRFTVDGGALFAMAGILDTWSGLDGRTCRSVAILTTTPNAIQAPIHDRMPVILDDSTWDRWLLTPPEEATGGALADLFTPWPAERLTVRPANPALGNARNEGPWLLDPD